MAKQLLSPFLFLMIFLLHCAKTSAQPPTQSPATSPASNITAILEKAGQFTTFIRLLKSTQEADQINTQISNSNQGMTIFAPTDNSFSNLKPGTLNSLTDQQKVQLVQFHVLPNLYSTTQFQTASNPLRTQAGNSDQFPLNVTSSGNQVNVTTGVNTATVANTIFTNSKLAVYQVDQVLLPLVLFGSPAPAPAPSKPEKDAPTSAPKGSLNNASVDASGAVRLNHCALAMVYFGAAAFVAVSF